MNLTLVFRVGTHIDDRKTKYIKTHFPNFQEMQKKNLILFIEFLNYFITFMMIPISK